MVRVVLTVGCTGQGQLSPRISDHHYFPNVAVNLSILRLSRFFENFQSPVITPWAQLGLQIRIDVMVYFFTFFASIKSS